MVDKNDNFWLRKILKFAKKWCKQSQMETSLLNTAWHGSTVFLIISQTCKRNWMVKTKAGKWEAKRTTKMLQDLIHEKNITAIFFGKQQRNTIISKDLRNEILGKGLSACLVSGFKPAGRLYEHQLIETLQMRILFSQRFTKGCLKIASRLIVIWLLCVVKQQPGATTNFDLGRMTTHWGKANSYWGPFIFNDIHTHTNKIIHDSL